MKYTTLQEHLTEAVKAILDKLNEIQKEIDEIKAKQE
jgi:hypothetical protein